MMSKSDQPDVATLADLLLEERDILAKRLTDEYFVDYPEFEAAHKPHARLRTREDFAYLIDFLSGAVAAENTASFVDVVRWTGRMLDARSVGPDVLADSLKRIGAGLASDTHHLRVE